MEWGSRKMLIEQAKEEVEILEYEQPNKFKSLKQELRAFISELESEDLLLKNTMFAETQESSTSATATNKTKEKRRRCSSKTDAVLERAQQCLHKIRHLKTSFS